MKKLLLICGFALLFVAEILRVYFIMPFPGSQKANTIDFAYWLSNNIVWIRIVGLLMITYPLFVIFRRGTLRDKIIASATFAIFVVVFCLLNFYMQADKMFYQPRNMHESAAGHNKIGKDKLVIGVMIGGKTKAYPIQFIGYHHQVRDTVGGELVMVTYCTVCRTGRVYSPIVKGKAETFRLVGMDHYNAMFEDATTGSWWQQANGKAITGPLKGYTLKEIPSRQTTLASWLRQHPDSKIMQPDTVFKDEYKAMAKYDKGSGKSDLTRRDKKSWKDKSWILGVAQNNVAKAYDWNSLVKHKFISDSLENLPLAIYLEKDNASFHVWSRELDGRAIRLKLNDGKITDQATGSVMSVDGSFVSGPMTGKKLTEIQGYQEFWHSWKTFHPQTLADQ
ncbi:DUF3179 domain-containing protein [Pedobacter sp. HMF7647]|uniref:DUF3179 domain-containing protein n=1 Tax=Hufsiella arboris TaxID=2695275 RepID=A0A7K1Y5Y5_9SPHI|nr:DUF3179 domain-containing (seleno)protein [Hufsiella arboris]MXV49985.1 DUF3179 domain-containing protein [Hufsiella arboris]